MTLGETVGNAQALFDTLADSLAEVEADTLGNTGGDAKALVDTLADTLAEEVSETLGEARDYT